MQKKYTLKEQIAYHKQCANTGKDINGNKLNLVQKVRHAVKADQKSKQLNRFMKTMEFCKENNIKPGGKKK